MSANRPIVLILTSDPAFSRELTAHWPRAPHSHAPQFIVLDGAFSRDLQGSNYDLAIADASCLEKRKHQDEPDSTRDQSAEIATLKQSLAAAAKPAILIHTNPPSEFTNFYNLEDPIPELQQESARWPQIAGLIGNEILRRRHAESRAEEAEQTCGAAQANATLGRYMIEMRTNINNALTTILGNAELLTLEPGLPATVQAQADTIRNMALRLNEVFRRFSSIEKELSVAAREAGKKAAQATAGRS